MHKKLALGLLSLPLCLFADGETDTMQQMPNNRQMKNGQKEMQAKQQRVSLDSARPESDNGWYIFADALYWHADIGTTDWAFKVDNSAAVERRHRQRSVDFKWAWGFKAGIGANIEHGMWDTNLYYTWFHTSSRSRASNVAPDNVIAIIEGGSAFQSGRIKWSLHYSMFDWELGGWYYLNDVLAIRPHVGVKGGWINQDIKSPLVEASGNVDRGRFKNNFWGVGPSFGVNTLWVLGNAGKRAEHRFSLFGDCGGALLYGHFHVKYAQPQYSSVGTLVGGFEVKGLDRNLAVAMLQGIFGLAWDTDFNQNKNHFTFKLGYELQYWFRQNQLVKVINGFANGTDRLSDDLALQGITAEFRFDF